MRSFRKKLALLIFCLYGLSVAAGSDAVENATQIQPLLVSSQIPDVTLKTPDGASLSLAKAVQEKPTVLIFYRGSW